MSASASVAEIGSFGVAGWLVQLLTAPGAILVNAVSFAWSALFIRRIQAPEPVPRPAAEREHVFREALAGASAVLRHPALTSLLAAAFFLEMAGRMFGVLYAVYLVDDVGFEPGFLGMVFAVGGITSLAGAWVASRPGVARRLGVGLPLAVAIRAAGMLFMPLTVAVSPLGYVLLVANQLVTDPAWMFYEIHETSLRQRLTSDELLGRVNATMRFAGFGAALAGTGLAALIGELAGAREGLFAAVAATAVAALVLLAFPVTRPARRAGSLSDAV
jgi:predicted MFS family arabinose efflux permease